MVEKPQYATPQKMLLRTGAQVPVVSAVHGGGSTGPPEGSPRVHPEGGPPVHPEEGPPVHPEEGPPVIKAEVDTPDDQVCVHESGDLCAEDIDKNWSVIPEVTPSTNKVMLEDIQIPDLGDTPKEEVDRLRQIIWRKRHLLMGKGNALPPAARGAVCDIDVGNARPIAQRVRKVASQFREKLADLIKGLLSSKIIQHSTYPWASPIVIIVKKNGVDIRLCIDYRVVNDLTRLMVYPMPLVNELLEDLDKALWYCSLDMASDFWVISMTERARLISAFITPLGLFEWRRMPFGLKNAPQIYQRLLDNALYGFLTIYSKPNAEKQFDLFEIGQPEADPEESILERRSYIDDILVTSGSWDDLCLEVERLLEVCDKWDLSISAVKSSWGCKKVDYLGHRVSAEGLEAHPKDLQSLVDLPLPTTLKAMQSFLGSLNYYSRFLKDYAIYASILYELREVDYHVLRRRMSETEDT
ncbi:unnamed protein product [Peronospora effusa]|nr:unnamed protein product [Peronospora effusa]